MNIKATNLCGGGWRRRLALECEPKIGAADSLFLFPGQRRFVDRSQGRDEAHVATEPFDEEIDVYAGIQKGYERRRESV